MPKKYLNLHKAGLELTADGATNLALQIVKSGVDAADEEFLKSEWCDDLLGYLGLKVSGPELLERKRRNDHVGKKT